MKRISDKKRLQIEAEYPERANLCQRCGGTWVETAPNRGYCQDGLCEECHQPSFWGLYPHETKHRSQGGKLCMANSRMLCQKCHSLAHNIRIRASVSNTSQPETIRASPPFSIDTDTARAASFYHLAVQAYQFYGISPPRSGLTSHS